MEPSTSIREAMAQVSALRARAQSDTDLAQAWLDIKHFQTRRFAATYQDLLTSIDFGDCTNFFLQELYSARDYSERDAQFARIGRALELTFPDQVVATAVTLAQLHQVTETLDLAMAEHWHQHPHSDANTRYRQAWRSVGQPDQRRWQLDTVLQIGRTLGELTGKPGLRLMLKMMRQPARLAGLGALQLFLETGFDRFGMLAKKRTAVETFLRTIHTREAAWMAQLDAAQPPGDAPPAQASRKPAPSP